MANQDLKKEAKQAGVYLYEIADKMGVCDMTLIRKLRYEFSEKQKIEVRNIISEIAAEKMLLEEGV